MLSDVSVSDFVLFYFSVFKLKALYYASNVTTFPPVLHFHKQTVVIYKYLLNLWNLITDIMAADRQLANEIEFDLRKFEDQQEQERQEQERRRRRSVNTPQQVGDQLHANKKWCSML